ncbi:UbiA family prenyltransferase [Haloferula sp.]|uniref:UbiA family prenyltransferase n=1 Tax=Haloferula sp. TaxID=2497595 RepID=UPI00329D2A35
MNQSEDTGVPLCVDLDGTFIRSDMLYEGLLRLLRHRPLLVGKVPLWLAEGKPRLKSQLTKVLPPPVTPPPVNTELESWLREEKARGRKILLVTASHKDSLGVIEDLFPFDEIIASDDETNLKGFAKARLLVERFGEKGFDYAGDSSADEAVWNHSRKAILVFHSEAKMEQLSQKYDVARTFCTNQTNWKDWFKALRVHQWAKNLLIALPFLAGHHFHTIWQLAGLFAAFLAMSLCASGTYLWNDLLDLEFDRAHPRKRHRLAASGRTSIERIAMASIALVGGGLLGAFFLNFNFGLLLVGYIITTLSYSLYFKRVALADIFVLAFLYLSRVIGGIIISEAVVSFWLFAFTFLLFLSLAAAKRLVELQLTSNKGDDNIQGRGYQTADLPAISGIGIATGVSSCIVLGLYSNSPQVAELYQRPEWLWGICVVALYWISRIWFLTHRSLMHDDPLVFALKDRGTWLLALAGLCCVLLAQPFPS